jgi:hypothetical protein
MESATKGSKALSEVKENITLMDYITHHAQASDTARALMEGAPPISWYLNHPALEAQIILRALMERAPPITWKSSLLRAAS